MDILPALAFRNRLAIRIIHLYLPTVFRKASEGAGGGRMGGRLRSGSYVCFGHTAILKGRNIDGIYFLGYLALERLLSCCYVYERKFSVGGISGIITPKAVTSRHLAGQHFEYNRCHGRMCYVCNADSAVLFDFAA